MYLVTVLTEVVDQLRRSLQFDDVFLSVIKRKGGYLVPFPEQPKQQGRRIHTTAQSHHRRFHAIASKYAHPLVCLQGKPPLRVVLDNPLR